MAYLRKIVLKGFKSFGKKTVSLRFSKGLTAVVGANGSGKSNVLDAICFTLGILSAKFVRAGAFSELIYSPASPSVEKPAEYARVTLHYDNSDRKIPIDSDDAVISRQVDRQGRGVYRLNGRLTTRTEILDILSMVGIDPEGYNIVPQGELARIIRLSHEERRQLMEKISGIATYDEKRERALKELEEVNQNLQRIEDRLKMIKEEFERLEKEKDDAVRWQKADKEIRVLQASLIGAQLAKARLSLEDVVKKLEAKNNQLSKLKSLEEGIKKTFEELSDRMSEIDSAVTKRDSELELVQTKAVELKQQISESESASNFIKEKLKSNLDQLKSLEDKLPNLKRLTENAWSEVRIQEDKKKSLIKSTEDANAIVKQLSAQILGLDTEFDKKRGQLDRIVKGIGDLNSELSKNNAKQQILDRERTYLEQEISRLKRVREDAERNHLAISSEVDGLRTEQEKLIEGITRYRKESERIEQESLTAQKQLEETDSIIKKTRDELIRIRAKIDALKEAKMYMSHGRRIAIREILRLKEKEKREGICGTVADLIEVPPEYSTAIEASAGSRLSYVVTKSEDDAARLIEFLKKTRIGRASFLPLDTMKRSPPAEYPKKRGVIGLAKDLVAFKKEYEPAIDYIFGRTLVVEDLDTARSLRNTDLRRVSLDGDIIEPAGLMIGGFYAKGKLGEGKPTLPRLEEDLKGLEETRQTLFNRLQDLRKTSEGRRENNILDERRLEVVTVQLNEKSSKVTETRNLASNSEKDLESKLPRLKEISAELKDLHGSIEQSKSKLSELSSTESSLRELLETSQASGIGEKVKERQNELERLASELKKVEIAIAQNVTKIEQLAPQTEEAKKQADELRAIIPSLQSELETKQAKLDSLTTELGSIEGDKERLKEEVDSLKKELSDKKATSRDCTKKLNATRDEINGVKMDINGLGINKEHLENDIVTTEKRIHEFAEIQPSLEAEVDEEDISAKVRILREEQIALGQVNMKAIEQYNAVKERFEEMNSRKEKVLKEKTSILEFMEKIEKEKLRKFMETFNDISSNFKEIFNYLAPSIRAELVIENPEQPLLGGIAIKVRTSGMEVTNIEALSGGEKSLTALALIFAIQKHQPAPFYVLDEIDAFLDEVNAVRVADLLKELSKKSQFIVVTLKQAVMSRADSLIGISKNADTGVSNIVSANIEELTKSPAA